MTDRLAAAIAELVDALRDELRNDATFTAPDRLLDVDEAAVALGIGRSALYAELATGRLKSLKVGRRRLIPAGAIAAYIAERAAA